MTAYQPAALSEVPAANLLQLRQAATLGRLVLYLGAGVSVAEPSCGPTGMRVADVLRPFAATMLQVQEEQLAGLTLEALAEGVATDATDRLDEFRDRAAVAWNFRGIEPNYGHTVVALLLREGLVQAISVNWDCGVEKAGTEAGVAIRGVADVTESIQLAHGLLPIYKVHGCATRPATLAVTQAEVDRPQAWAVGRTQGALAGGVVAFVGLGTVGLYVQEPFPELASAWASEAQNIAVVDPELSPGWGEALGAETAESVHVARTADAFLDELLRAVVRDALDTVLQLARELAVHEDWAAAMVEGFGSLRQGFDATTADGVLRWWRDGVVDTMAGRRFVTELPGQRCMMTVALLAGRDTTPVAVAGRRGRVTVSTDTQYFEIVCRPGQHVSDVQVVARHRIDRRIEDALYPSPKLVTVVVADALGQFPSDQAPLDIAAGDEEPTDIATGAERFEMRFVAAEDGVQGPL
jgi:hypothetical protein